MPGDATHLAVKPLFLLLLLVPGFTLELFRFRLYELLALLAVEDQ